MNYGYIFVDGRKINLSSASEQTGFTDLYTDLTNAIATGKPIWITNLAYGASGANPLTPAPATVYPDSTSHVIEIGKFTITTTSAGVVTVVSAANEEG